MLGLKEKKRISHGPKLENFDFYIFSKDQRKSSHTNSPTCSAATHTLFLPLSHTYTNTHTHARTLEEMTERKNVCFS